MTLAQRLYLLCYWKDPDFDSSQSAFYYLRVLDIPTPRWVLYDHVRLGTRIPGGVALVQQERAIHHQRGIRPRIGNQNAGDIFGGAFSLKCR